MFTIYLAWINPICTRYFILYLEFANIIQYCTSKNIYSEHGKDDYWRSSISFIYKIVHDAWEINVSQTFMSIIFLSSFDCREHRNFTNRVLPDPVSPIIMTGMSHLWERYICAKLYESIWMYHTEVNYKSILQSIYRIRPLFG